MIMKISKEDAYKWFSFFASIEDEEELMTEQTELVYNVFYQLERSVEKIHKQLLSEIPDLKMLANRTYYVGPDEKFPKGCKSCLLGTGLGAIRKTNKCNAACKFCYDYGVLDEIPPIGEGMWEIGETKFREDDIELLLDIQRKPTGVAYVYLEPFMEIEKYYNIISIFNKNGIYQHMYTNGIACSEENLKALGEAGLPELRFNLGATNCSDKVIENIGIAKKYIPRVGIETPMTPEFYNAFSAKKEKILATGLDFMNCAELHLNENNIANYEGESLYVYRHGYISPIFSRVLTLKLMKTAATEKWPIVVHDCSNRTKFTRDLNLAAKEGGWFGKSGYSFEFPSVPFEYFLPVLEDDNIRFED